MAGIYIHIPFCRQACHYCDFHFSTSAQGFDSMIASIQKELVLRKNYLGGEAIDTIYFGGGTPSFVDVNHIISILKTVYEEYEVSTDAEITLEANPDDLTQEKSSGLFAAGINRLSIGIQSFSDDDLRFMNRAHDSRQAMMAMEQVKNAGFENISIDLIYGVPGSSELQWKKNIETALALDVEHLSCYALTVESKTVFADMIRKKKASAPDEERTASDFEILMKHAADAGFEHYEISNFARNGKYSKHNTSYWLRKKYLGAGPSAHSYDGNSRQWNVSNNARYIRAMDEGEVLFEKEILTDNNKFNEYILTSLRTMWGINMNVIEKEFGLRKDELLIQLNKLVMEEMLISSEDHFSLTHKGKFFADRIASDLFV